MVLNFFNVYIAPRCGICKHNIISKRITLENNGILIRVFQYGQFSRFIFSMFT